MTAPQFTPSQARIHHAMLDLLSRAGLEYRGGSVEAAGLRIHYLDYGPDPASSPGGEPETVLLLHGGGAGGAIWFRQIAALSKQFRVIAPDNPLFGLSSQVAVPAPIEDFTTAYLCAFLDALDVRKVMFAGLSAGGAAGIFFALRHPERVQRLAVLDASSLGPELPWIIRLIALPGFGQALTRPGRRSFDFFFSTWEAAHPDGPESEPYRRYCFETTRSDGHSRALRLTLPVFADLGGQRRVLRDEELSAVRTPTLIVWGEKDRFFPVSHARRAFELMPRSSLHILPGAGHVTPWDEPDRVSELLTGFFGARADAAP